MTFIINLKTKLAIIRKPSSDREQEVKFGDIRLAAQTVGVDMGEIIRTLEKGRAWQNEKWEVNVVGSL